MGDSYEEYPEEGEAQVTSRFNPVISIPHKNIVIPVASITLLTVIYGIQTYGSFKKAAEKAYKKSLGKITNSPTPIDWREVDMEDLSTPEKEKVKYYALGQAIFDTMTMMGITIGFLMLISLYTNRYTLIGLQGKMVNINTIFAWKDNLGYFLLAFGLLLAGSYAFLQSFVVGVKDYVPFYMTWWYGYEYTYYFPMYMLGGAALAFGGLYYLFGSYDNLDAFKADVVDTSFSDNIKYYTGLFLIGYSVYAFYGSYITSIVRKNEKVEPYLDFLYPATVSLIIAAVTYKVTQVLNTNSSPGDAAMYALFLCGALLAFRIAGGKVGEKYLFDNYAFWNKLGILFIVALILFGLATFKNPASTAGLRKMAMGYGRKGMGYTQAQYSQIMADHPSAIVLLVVFGAFLFFSMQLFWSTTLFLGDLGLAAVSAFFLVFVFVDVATLHDKLSVPIYSGFLVTGVLWFTMYQKEWYKWLKDDAQLI